MVGTLINYELEKIWKDTVVAYSRYYNEFFLQGGKASDRIAGIPTEIRTEYLPKEMKLILRFSPS
jgi:hypothetical protein